MVNAQLSPVKVGSYHKDDFKTTQSKDKISRNILKGTSPHLEFVSIHSSTMMPGAEPSTAHANEDMEECIFVMEGTMKVTIEGKSQILGPESVILLMPQQMHHLENIGKGNLTYYVMKYKSKSPMDIARGQAAGGSLMLNTDSLTYKKSSVGGGRGYFDRPTAMCERFELHVTKLDKKGQSHAPHDHRESEILLVISGETEMKIDGKMYEGKVGDFYFIPSGLFHGVSNASDKPCSYFLFRWM
ncbi:Cupin domain-containing protein [Spirosomataceae bacterium TFI 002]|nr:Cupin domain-containing protein [Spirosomataceae bacterium TFI 002]